MISDIIKLLTDSTLPNWTITILIIVTVLINLKNGSLILKLVDLAAIRKRKPTNNITKKYLQNHPIFDNIYFWKNTRLWQLNFGSEFKTKVFRDILSTELESIRKHLIDFINNSKKDNNCLEFNKCVRDLLDDINKTNDIYWKNLNIPLHKVIIGDYKHWDTQNYTWLLASLDEIGQTTIIYEDYFQRIEAMLNVLNTYLTIKLSNIDTGLKEINGKYNNLKYNG